MKKQTTHRWQSLLLVTIAVVLLLGANFSTIAQDANSKYRTKVT